MTDKSAVRGRRLNDRQNAEFLPALLAAQKATMPARPIACAWTADWSASEYGKTIVMSNEARPHCPVHAVELCQF